MLYTSVNTSPSIHHSVHYSHMRTLGAITPNIALDRKVPQ